MDVESDTCLVVVTVFKIVASALRVEGWVRFPPSPPAFARAARELRLGQPFGLATSSASSPTGEGWRALEPMNPEPLPVARPFPPAC